MTVPLTLLPAVVMTWILIICLASEFIGTNAFLRNIWSNEDRTLHGNALTLLRKSALLPVVLK